LRGAAALAVTCLTPAAHAHATQAEAAPPLKTAPEEVKTAMVELTKAFTKQAEALAAATKG